VSEFTNTFYTLHTKLGIKGSERPLILKYRGVVHKYIQTEMEFLDISSMGVTYQYVVKIEQKFKKQNKWGFGSANPKQPKYGKGGPKSQGKGHSKDGHPRITSPSHKQIRVMGNRRTLESGAISTKFIGTTLMKVTPNDHCWLR